MLAGLASRIEALPSVEGRSVDGQCKESVVVPEAVPVAEQWVTCVRHWVPASEKPRILWSDTDDDEDSEHEDGEHGDTDSVSSAVVGPENLQDPTAVVGTENAGIPIQSGHHAP